MSGEVERTRVTPGVEVWTLKHEARANAVSPKMLESMRSACAELSETVVVLQAAGHKGFCAGFDLRALREFEDAKVGAPDRALIETAKAMGRAPALFIGALFGHVIGAGVELACCCDLRFARDDTTFKVPAARLGVVYHARGLARMHAVLGGNLSRRLVLGGQAATAAELVAAGAISLSEDPAADALALAKDLSQARVASILANRHALDELDREQALAEDFVAGHERARGQAYAAMIKNAG